jgi:nucleoside-diphosphate-sugar epimerase
MQAIAPATDSSSPGKRALLRKHRFQLAHDRFLRRHNHVLGLLAMIALVTGGAGFIGSHLVEALLHRGNRVRVLDNLSTGSRDSLQQLAALRGDLDVIEASLLDPEALRRACAGIEMVFHLAAVPSVPRSVEFPFTTHETNATGTLLLLCAARDAGVRRLIYAASSSAYGDAVQDDGRARAKAETTPSRPLSPYAVSKLAGEQYCRIFADIYGLETISLRYFNVFGPRQNPDSPYGAVIPKFAAAMLRGTRPRIFGDGKQARDFTYVANAVAANLAAAEAPPAVACGEVINVACGRSTTLLELVESLNRILGTDFPPEHAPPRRGDILHSVADITKAERLLGYRVIVPLDEGLASTVEHLRRVT